MTEDGERTPIDAARARPTWLTVEGLAKADGSGRRKGKARPRRRRSRPARSTTSRSPTRRRCWQNRLTIVDTPGVNDINEQRAEITYGYLPRADAAVFLLDATQILTASERQFLEERILRSTRDRLIFVVAKADLLDEAELAETLRFARQHLAAIVPEPAIFPVSAQARAGRRSRRVGAGRVRRSALGATVAQRAAPAAARQRARRRDAAVGVHPPEPGASTAARWSCRVPELEERIARAQERLHSGKKVLETRRRDRARRDRGAQGARAPGPGRLHRRAARRRWPPTSTPSTPPTSASYLSFFVQDTWKAWTEAEGERIAAELERLAEQVIQVANENIREVRGRRRRPSSARRRPRSRSRSTR